MCVCRCEGVRACNETATHVQLENIICVFVGVRVCACVHETATHVQLENIICVFVGVRVCACVHETATHVQLENMRPTHHS